MTILAFALSVFPVAVLVSRPESGDFYAAAGAFIAAVSAILEGRSNKRTRAQIGSSVTGCVVCGVMGPSAAHSLALKFSWIQPGDALFLSWSVWGLCGFFLASNGWLIAHGINLWIQGRTRKIFGLQDPGVTSDSARTMTQDIDQGEVPVTTKTGNGRARM